jgi:hypothetical protein
MKIFSFLAPALALLWLIIRTVAGEMDLADYEVRIGVFANMLFLVLIPFLTLRREIAQSIEKQPFIVDLRTALRPSILYVVLVSVLIYVYYSFINPEFIASKRAIAEEQLIKHVPDEAAYTLLQSEDPTLKSINREQYLAKNREGFDMFDSRGMQAGGSFVALSFTALIYGLIITVLLRKVLFRNT